MFNQQGDSEVGSASKNVRMYFPGHLSQWFSVRGVPTLVLETFLLLVIMCLPCVHVNSHSLVPRTWSSRVVTTRLGLTRGFLFMPRGFDGVEVFLAIPYASPPVGSLRLMPPVSGSPWSGTKMNEEPSPVCPQVFPLHQNNNNFHMSESDSGESDDDLEVSVGGGSGGNGRGMNETEMLKRMPRGKLAQLKRLAPFLKNQSEDCLYLNIYVPLSVSEGKVDRPLPVLVFVHGDDNSYGAGFPYDPSMLVSQGNIIVITFNFRLGILGFLNANSDGYFKSPANFALLDQIAALHWVQENIGPFGGDRGNVTLMGHGKGAMFVNFLMISNALPSEPLFHRVILMSGSALSPLTVGLSNGKDLAKKFAGRFKCPIEPPSNMLQCLRQLPLQYFLDSEMWRLFGPSDDGVVIEHGIRENILRNKLSRYPMIFGVTKAEFLPTLGELDATYGLETEKRREVLRQFIDGFYSAYRSEILAAAIHEYTDWERPVQHPISVRDETLDALTDAQIVAPMVKVGELHSQANSRTYFYVFEYQSKVSDYAQRLGCVPGEDLLYVFGVPLYLANLGESDLDHLEGVRQSGGTSGSSGNSNSNSFGESLAHSSTVQLGFFTGNFTRNEVQLSQTLVHLWANFVKTGSPSSESNPGSVGEGGSPSSGSGLGGLGGDSSSVSAGGNQNRYPQQDKSSSSSSSSSTSKTKLIDWSQYDTQYKKYLSIEAKPRVRSYYRAHKLSFWLHLVPELMRNGGGMGGGGGGGGPPLFHSRPDGLGYPGIGTPSNSSTPHPPSIQLVGPPYWEHHPFYYSGNYSSYPGGDVSGPLGSRPNHRFHHHGHHESDGYQIYSTALSVTIAVGCSLLILNILVFAAFYYYRDKTRTNRQSSDNLQEESHHHQSHHQAQDHHQHISSQGCQEGERSTGFSPIELQLQNSGITRSGATTDSSRQLSQNISSEGIPLPSLHNTPIRLKENGQVLNLIQQQQQQYGQQSGSPQMLPMPNICGDLPTSNVQQQFLPDQTNRSFQQQQQQLLEQQHHHHHHHGHCGQGGGGQSSTLPSNKRKQQTQQPRNPLGNFELSMPDAILAAAMMLNYRQNNASQVQGGGDPFFSHKSMSGGKRSSLNMKEQLLLSAGIGVAAAANTSGGNAVGTSGSGGAGCSGAGGLNTTNLGTPINSNVLLNRAGVVVGNLQGKTSSGYNSGSVGGESSYGGGGGGSNVSNINGTGGDGGGNSGSSNVIQFDFESSGGNAKIVPKPPKRHTPMVKFSPDTFSSADGSICSGSGSVLNSTTTNVNISCAVSPTQSSTLLGSQSHGIIHPGGIISATASSCGGGALNISPSNLPPPPPQLAMGMGSISSGGGGGGLSSTTTTPTTSNTATTTQLKSSLKKVSNYSGTPGSGPGVPAELNV